jgi:hypothetical protein
MIPTLPTSSSTASIRSRGGSGTTAASRNTGRNVPTRTKGLATDWRARRVSRHRSAGFQ